MSQPKEKEIEMTERTIQEIQEQFSSEGPAIINNYHTELNEIRDIRQPEAGGYLDRLTDEQRMGLLREQKLEKAMEAHEHAFSSYREQVEYYHRQLEKRRAHLTDRLFKVESADAGMKAAVATEGELREMLEYATLAGNSDIARAVFTAAHKKNLGDLMSEFWEADPEARELYQEYAEIPPQEILDRQLDVEAVLPAPDPNSLMPMASSAGWS